ncbi:MAG: penicillin-insensitive murein endopeptidase [Bdellovibrionales bacterium]|nr:penicillin-insensitive murein endopeptidase [Bdellovibrionales bacterium]
MHLWFVMRLFLLTFLLISSAFQWGCSPYRANSLNETDFVTTEGSGPSLEGMSLKPGYSPLVEESLSEKKPQKKLFVKFNSPQLKIEGVEVSLFFEAVINGQRQAVELTGQIDERFEARLFEPSNHFVATVLCLDFSSCQNAVADVYYDYKGNKYKKRFEYLKAITTSSPSTAAQEPVTVLEEEETLDYGAETTSQPEPEVVPKKGRYVGIHPSREFYSKLKDVHKDFSEKPAEQTHQQPAPQSAPSPTENQVEPKELPKDPIPSSDVDSSTGDSPSVELDQSKEAVQTAETPSLPEENTAVGVHPELNPETTPEETPQKQEASDSNADDSKAIDVADEKKGSFAEDEGYGKVEVEPNFEALFDQSVLNLNLQEGGEAVQSIVSNRFNGQLLNASELVSSSFIDVPSKRKSKPTNYGTGLLVSLLSDAFAIYRERYSDDKLIVNNISAQSGGTLKFKYRNKQGKLVEGQHKSHKAGLDVDVAYLSAQPGFRRYVSGDSRDVGKGLVSKDFDYQRNFDFFKILVQTKAVNWIFVNKSLRKGFCEWGKRNNLLEEDKEVFRRIYGITGHRDHIHLRFKCSPYYKRCDDQEDPPSNNVCS